MWLSNFHTVLESIEPSDYCMQLMWLKPFRYFLIGLFSPIHKDFSAVVPSPLLIQMGLDWSFHLDNNLKSVHKCLWLVEQDLASSYC